MHTVHSVLARIGMMKFGDVKSALKEAANGSAHAHGVHERDDEALATRAVATLNEVIDRSVNEEELLRHLKLLADDFIKEDYAAGCEDRKHSTLNTIFSGMLLSVIMTYGEDHKTKAPQSDIATGGVVDFTARRLQAQTLSPDLCEELNVLRQYYDFGFDAMQALDKRLLPTIEYMEPPPTTMYEYAFRILRERHPDHDDDAICDRIDSHIDAVLQHYMNECFYQVLHIAPDSEAALEAADMPLQSFYLIAKAEQVAMKRALDSKLPEDTDLFNARYARAMREVLQDIAKQDRYACESPQQFMEVASWLAHACNIAQTPPSR